MEKVTPELVEFRIHPDTRYRLPPGGKPVWLDADGQPAGPSNVWKLHDPTIDSLRGARDPFAQAESIEEIGDSLLRCRFENTAAFREGTRFQWRHGTRNQQGAILLESRDLRLERIALHASNGLGILAQLCHNLSLREVRIEPRKETGRSAAAFADGVQVFGGTGEVRIEGCRFVGAHDDAINIYNYLLHIDAWESSRTLRLRFPSVEQCGFNVFFPGDKIGFRRERDLLPEGVNEVVASELLDKMTLRLTLRDELPADLSGLHIENLTRMPDRVVIRDNFFNRIATRAILINTSRETLIEGNTFRRIPMSAILAKTPDGRYWLQNHIDGLTIRDNTFIECAGHEDERFTPGTGIINFNLQTRQVVPDRFAHRGVRIEGNRFINRTVPAVAVKARGVDGLAIRGNIFESPRPSAHLATVFGCGGVKLEGNRLDTQNGRATIVHGQMEPGEIHVAAETGWSVEAAE